MHYKIEERRLESVKRRNGTVVPFDENRIRVAIRKAVEATGENVPVDIILHEVLTILHYKQGGTTIDIEEIQNTVESALIGARCLETARAYMSYRQQHALLRQIGDSVDVGSTIDEYLNRQDWRVNANANQGFSVGGLILNNSGKLVANYWLNRVYPPEVGAAHRDGDFHIHDLDMLSGYCAGWSLRMLLSEGFNGVTGKVEAVPPKHLSSAVGQMINFLGTLQNEWAGAQAFSSFDTYLAPFVRQDKLSFEVIKQNIQEFIYCINVPSRWGMQTPFVNITFDWTCPEDLRTQHPVIGGEEVEFTYGDLQPEMDLINRAFIEIMSEGDARGRIFTFPIPTYNITPDFDWNSPNADLLFSMTAKYGLPYFQNFLNSDLSPQMVRSMCCRLQLDVRELLKRGNGLFGSAEQTGSLGVVTINLARLGFLHKDDREGLFKALDRLLVLAKSSLEIKRKTIERFIEMGFLPYTKRYLGSLRNHFSTIGVNGMHECLRNFTGDQSSLLDESGRIFAGEVMDYIRERLVQFQTETGHMYNLEATPAESTAYRFAKEDRKRFPGIIQAGTEEAPYYTNSTQLPVGATDDPFFALSVQEPLQRKYTGGTVFHVYLGERVPDATTCKKLVQKILSNYRIPYITISPTFSICNTHGYLKGEQPTCPTCGAATEVWTRVMGYHRPVSEFNKGKKSEYAERKLYSLRDA